MQRVRLVRAVLLLVFIFMGCEQLQAQDAEQPKEGMRQLDVAAGVGAFYIPGMGARFERPEFVSYGGLQQAFSDRQLLGLGLRLGYARSQYQGDALQLQLLLHITPALGEHIETGLALGVGYQFAFYPSRSLRFADGHWEEGSSRRGMFQFPLQLSLGYRSIRTAAYAIRPYLAYQLKLLPGYSPALAPVPVSEVLVGLKIFSLEE